ncbi:MAG: hypothetical protein J5504_01805, partial [Butyrivibrio sp.]|nr:hypothetical protein [Butyrivibrio sp.]
MKYYNVFPFSLTRIVTDKLSLNPILLVTVQEKVTYANLLKIYAYFPVPDVVDLLETVTPETEDMPPEAEETLTSPFPHEK